MIDLLGYLAGILAMIGFMPQVIKSWRTRKIEDLSKYTGIAMILSSLTWIAYGIAILSIPIIVTNIFVFICVMLIFLVHFAP